MVTSTAVRRRRWWILTHWRRSVKQRCIVPAEQCSPVGSAGGRDRRPGDSQCPGHLTRNRPSCPGAGSGRCWYLPSPSGASPDHLSAKTCGIQPPPRLDADVWEHHGAEAASSEGQAATRPADGGPSALRNPSSRTMTSAIASPSAALTACTVPMVGRRRPLHMSVKVLGPREPQRPHACASRRSAPGRARSGPRSRTTAGWSVGQSRPVLGASPTPSAGTDARGAGRRGRARLAGHTPTCAGARCAGPVHRP